MSVFLYGNQVRSNSAKNVALSTSSLIQQVIHWKVLLLMYEVLILLVRHLTGRPFNPDQRPRCARLDGNEPSWYNAHVPARVQGHGPQEKRCVVLYASGADS